MPLLQNLPIELLAQIMRYLLPDDVDSFSDACKTFRIITSKVLPRHEELKQNYNKVACGFVGSTLCHPLVLVRQILKDSEIVWYVKTMLIGLGGDRITRHKMYEVAWREARYMVFDYKNDIIQLIHACLGLYLLEYELQDWIGEILTCDEETIVVLLASAFPCLDQICYNGDCQPDEKLHTLALRVVQENHSNPRASHALSKLAYIKEEGSNAKKFGQMILFKSLRWLPSTRRYGGTYLRQKEVHEVPTKSSLTSLEFSDCLIRVPALREIFGSISNLEEFTYRHHWAYEGQGLDHDMICWWKRWQPAEIILSLVKFASHSLVKLDLTRNGTTETQCARETHMRMEGAAEDNGRDEEQEDWTFDWFKWKFSECKIDKGYDLPKTFIGSLRKFQVLKNIRVQSEAFVEEYVENTARSRTVHPLADILPASAEYVVLALPQLCGEDSCRLIEGMPELKAERFPKLKSVIFESNKSEE